MYSLYKGSVGVSTCYYILIHVHTCAHTHTHTHTHNTQYMCVCMYLYSCISTRITYSACAILYYNVLVIAICGVSSDCSNLDSDTSTYLLRGVSILKACFRPIYSAKTLTDVASSIRKNPSFFFLSRKWSSSWKYRNAIMSFCWNKTNQ